MADFAPRTQSFFTEDSQGSGRGPCFCKRLLFPLHSSKRHDVSDFCFSYTSRAEWVNDHNQTARVRLCSRTSSHWMKRVRESAYAIYARRRVSRLRLLVSSQAKSPAPIETHG